MSRTTAPVQQDGTDSGSAAQPQSSISQEDQHSREDNRVAGGATATTNNETRDETRFRKAIVVQANLYVLAFFATYIFAWISQFSLAVLKKDSSEDNVFVLLASIFFPLGGFYNILVYTR